MVLAAALATLGVPLPARQTRDLAEPGPGQVQPRIWLDSSMGLLQAELTARFGPAQRQRIQRGLAQIARFWLPGDGGADVFETFVRAQFAGTATAQEALFTRLAGALGGSDGPVPVPPPLPPGLPLPIDALLDGYDPGAHVVEDCFENKLAFAVLLNFPLTSLEERVRDGAAWTCRQWAEAWLAARFAHRVPARVCQAVAQARAAAERFGATPAAAGDGRYPVLLQTFQALRRLDPYAPMAPTHPARTFEERDQLPEARVTELLEQVCASPLLARTAHLVRRRLGRGLRPSDLRYPGFRPATTGGDQPAPERIAPPPAALPSPAFGAALAWTFQPRERMPGPAAEARALDVLDGFWTTCGLAGGALVDLAVWQWLYAHPAATAPELRDATQHLAKDVWNRYFATAFGLRDSPFLGADPRLLDGSLDLAEAAIGRLIAFQLQRQVDQTGQPEQALRRMTRLGRLTPDLWLQRATGRSLGSQALLEAAEGALGTFR